MAEAAHRGEIPREAAIGLLAGYVVAAFDTTISAISHGLLPFAQNPAQRQLDGHVPGLRASIRQLAAIVHRDVIPPESANLVFAKLVRARALILNSVQDRSGNKPSALAGLLFLGEHHKRWAVHNGFGF